MALAGDTASKPPAAPAAKRARVHQVQAVSGTVDMQQVVRELSDLKRDLRDWRSRTSMQFGAHMHSMPSTSQCR